MTAKIKSPFSMIWHFLKSWKSKVKKALLFSTLNKFFDILPEVLIGVSVDLVVNREVSFLGRLGIIDPMDQLIVLGVITFLIWILESIFQFLYQLEWRNLAQEVQHQLRTQTYQHIQKLDMHWLEKNQTGNLLSILNDDINQLERFLDDGFNQLWQLLVSTLMIGVIFCYLSPKVAALALLPVPFIFWSALFFEKKMNKLYQGVREVSGNLAAKLSSNLSGMGLIKSYTAENYESKQVEKLSLQYVASNQKVITWSSAYIPFVRVAILTGFLFTLLIGGKLALQGDLNIGAYSALIFLTQRILWPFTALGAIADNFERAMASARRVFNLLDESIVIQDGTKAFPKYYGPLAISFKDIHFSYDKNMPKIFNGINIDIQGGQMVAFVGNTGSGKSTLAKLLLRFYDPTQGNIFIENMNVKDLSLNQLRSLVGYVGQDNLLFHGSILENVSFGNLKNESEQEPPMQMIEDVCSRSEIHQFIQSLPDKYQTLVGERGQKLSGGQRQRISIARALYKDAPIMLLDEATSAIDNETEWLIQRSIDELAKVKTLIVIAHRLSTIVKADVIYVFNDGEIVEKGTHQELLEKRGFYFKLWTIQTGA